MCKEKRNPGNLAGNVRKREGNARRWRFEERRRRRRRSTF